jgi:beta-glucosidase
VTQPDAAALVAAMTLDEKLSLVHSRFAVPMLGIQPPEGAIGSAAFVPGIERLGVTPVQETDASLGVTNPAGARPPADATALPASLLLGATFDPGLARASGAAVGAEAAAQGFDVLLGGGCNLAREPRNGRNFEYVGEDPLLSGTIAGASVAGVQSQGVVCTVKHFVLNAQETGRVVLSANIGEAALRESDLLAFQLAIELGRPGSVMTGYNRVNGDWAGENAFLLNTVLKGDWGWTGFVMSDWGATHSTEKAALAGLDRQSGQELDPEPYFDEPLRAAVLAGRVPEARLDDMVRRILLARIEAGQLDPGRTVPVPDLAANARVAQDVAEQGMVLLANDGVLPLGPAPGRVALIGGHADIGVLSGGGSSQVTPPGHTEAPDRSGRPGWSRVYHPSPPLAALRAALPSATVEFDPGDDPARAAALAAGADVAVVVAEQWAREGADLPGLELPDGQDELIGAVAAANPRTVVVLETGGPVLMPWLDRVGAVLAAWYPGGRGGEALAALLTGRVSPSGRLPMTFPASLDQLPRPEHTDPATTTSEPGLPPDGFFDVDYDIEGSDVGYRWFQRTGRTPLFPFGHGLTYSTFEYGEAEAEVTGDGLRLGVRVTNAGSRAAIETPQFYVAPADGSWPARLAGWARLALEPAASGRAEATVDPRVLARFDPAGRRWRVAPGSYVVWAGRDAADRTLAVTVELAGMELAP